MKTNHMLITGVFLLVLAVPAALYGQEVDKNDFQNALGLYGSTLAGNAGGGLHYQRWAGRLGFQITAGGVFSPNESMGRTLSYSAVAEGLWSVYGNTFTNWLSGRLYLWASAGHHGYISSLDDYRDENLDDETFVPNGIGGFGIGIETVLFQHFSFPFQFGYTAEFPTNPMIGFSTSGGLRYRF